MSSRPRRLLTSPSLGRLSPALPLSQLPLPATIHKDMQHPKTKFLLSLGFPTFFSICNRKNAGNEASFFLHIKEREEVKRFDWDLPHCKVERPANHLRMFSLPVYLQFLSVVLSVC